MNFSIAEIYLWNANAIFKNFLFILEAASGSDDSEQKQTNIEPGSCR